MATTSEKARPTNTLGNLSALTGRFVEGLPYLKKELARRISLRTGKVLTTPTSYYVIFSGRCNLECPFCKIWDKVDPTLPEEVMFRIVREAKELSGTGFHISLSGGEPTIYRPLYEILELCQKLGVNFGFTTNGLALTKKNVQRIVASDPFNVNISLESVDPKVNDALRPFSDGTKRSLAGIECLVEEKRRTGSRVSVMVKSTIMDQNYRTLPDLVRHFGKNSGVQINFQPFVGVREDPFWVQDLAKLADVIAELKALRNEGYPIIGNDQTLDGFFGYLKDPPLEGETRSLDLEGEKRNCDIGLRTMFVKPDGDVFFCDFLKHPIGNIHKQTLSQIYYGAIAARQRNTMVYCSIDCQQTCKRPIPLSVKAKTFLRMGREARNTPEDLVQIGSFPG
jgi:MoaA/NifB/PqqE/SkfB family radical SAM enzyme